MLPFECVCCDNCEHLRVDNYCLVKEKFILTKDTRKIQDCVHFSCKWHVEQLERIERRALGFLPEESKDRDQPLTLFLRNEK